MVRVQANWAEGNGVLRAPRGARINGTSRGDCAGHAGRTSDLCRPSGQPLRVRPFTCTTTVCAATVRAATVCAATVRAATVCAATVRAATVCAATAAGNLLSFITGPARRSRVRLLRRRPVMHQGRFQLLVFSLRQLAG